ncbi:hypothetical protein SAMN05216337_10284 [Bradyrhizobium brasilense]|uniref:Uncharacterized protein n=1 Tax=Bradyrhizobium brasilense TaxID=1419277 RepID=A0A1G7DIS1_9BRAD|nr:hypothetical protein [Bradyrhizobium brasilense]SDE51411.1 hypothetical protein SAMN05216337_10284 [Bradyrhizobium brasilense]
MELFSEVLNRLGVSRTGRIILFGLSVAIFGVFLLWETANILVAANITGIPNWLFGFYIAGPKLLVATLPLVLAAVTLLTFGMATFGLQKESKDYTRKISRRESPLRATL